MSVTESTRGNLMAGLSQDLKELGKTVGPCQSMGLMTGGGLPHGNFATSMRAVPGVKEIIEQIYRQDGRYVDGAIYGLTRQAILLSRSDQRCELKMHRDNNIVGDTPEIYRLQAQILLHPPALLKFTRTGVLTSLVPMTDEVVRDFAMVPGSQCSWKRDTRDAWIFT